MPETEQAKQDHDFIAPDESQRVEDPEKAEAMARASDPAREVAATQRKMTKGLKEMFKRSGQNPPSSEGADRNAIEHDRLAEELETKAGEQHDQDSQKA